MPIPQKKSGEKHQDFVQRCMSNEKMVKEYPSSKQRVAVCLGKTDASLMEQVCEIIEQDPDVENITAENLYIPSEEEYVCFGEQTEDYDFSDLANAAEYQGRKVQLGKPFRTPKGPKKFSVYVKNDKGNVVKVNFGDPNMKIKKNIPERRKSFRARHNCDNPGPRWKARYWSCKAW